MVDTLPVPAAQLVAQRVGAVRLPRRRLRRARPTARPTVGTGTVLVAVDDGIVTALRGVGPGTAHLPLRLIWVASAPRATWGDDLVDHVLALPGGPTVWDTARLGAPDLVRLAYAAYTSSAAARVVCAAEPAVARRLVRELGRRGVPATTGRP